MRCGIKDEERMWMFIFWKEILMWECLVVPVGIVAVVVGLAVLAWLRYSIGAAFVFFPDLSRGKFSWASWRLYIFRVLFGPISICAHDFAGALARRERILHKPMQE
ncbi:MAG: hypothetical protein WC757_01160 [Candidatus Paceibacterota bacterium]|jgi:hypothetical protein